MDAIRESTNYNGKLFHGELSIWICDNGLKSILHIQRYYFTYRGNTSFHLSETSWMSIRADGEEFIYQSTTISSEGNDYTENSHLNESPIIINNFQS